MVATINFFEKGEINAAEELIKKLTDYYNGKKIYIIDPYFGGRKWIKKHPIINVSAIFFLIKEAKKEFGANIIFLSPDKGGKRRTGISGIKKERLSSFQIKHFTPKTSLR